MTKSLIKAELLSYGLTEDEISQAKRKIEEIVSQRSNKKLKLEVEHEVSEILLQMCLRTVEKATEYGCKLARHRNSKTLDVKDVKFYVDNVLNLQTKTIGYGEEEPNHS